MVLYRPDWNFECANCLRIMYSGASKGSRAVVPAGDNSGEGYCPSILFSTVADRTNVLRVNCGGANGNGSLR